MQENERKSGNLKRQFYTSILVPSFACAVLVAGAADIPDPNRLEFGGIPVLCGDSDIGFAFGALFSLARFRENYDPYRWRAECLIMMSAKSRPEGGIQLPYHDDYLRLDFPGLMARRLRLLIDLGFGRYLTSGYFGMGNASQAPAMDSPRFYQYDHANIHFRVRTLARLRRHLQVMSGCTFSQHWIKTYKGSLLEEQLLNADPTTAELLKGVGPHAIAELDLGCVYDTRNSELTPSTGAFHEVSVRGSPWLTTADGIAYCGVNAMARLYRPLLGETVSAAGRIAGDFLFGQPPFYELSCYGGLGPKSAIGGGNAVRGVPEGRYFGKAKLLGNAELRSKLVDFCIVKQEFNLGAVGFIDAGRTWADYGGAGQLDGRGAGLKYGVGGGPRVQWGKTFLLRIDVAWSPDANPVGFYVDVNHIF